MCTRCLSAALEINGTDVGSSRGLDVRGPNLAGDGGVPLRWTWKEVHGVLSEKSKVSRSLPLGSPGTLLI